MPIRFRAVVTGVLLMVCPLCLSAQSAPPTRQFVRTPVLGDFTPAIALGAQRPVTVVLTIAGDPVAVARGRMPGKRLAVVDAVRIERDLRAAQAALVPAIQAHGASVLGTFQHAINGIKVRTTADKIPALAALPGVVAVKPVAMYRANNATSVPFLGTPQVWENPPGLHGEHIKIAIIDSGIDYTHANFGGPGTVAAFNTAKATSASPADPSMFGPGAPKVKGGIDLVGDGYDPSKSDPAHAPRPDANPLDCEGHGSHVAGTAAGFGVTSAGATFAGPYDKTTPNVAFRIGPGVAPLADLYAVRVLSCAGTGMTDVVIDAIDWAVQHGMDVINMSLGGSYGTVETADAEASHHAVEAGIVVVASAGNSGASPYIQGAPASGDKVISVAAMDSVSGFPGADLAVNIGATVHAQNSNGAPFVDATTLPIVVLRNPDSSISLGCNDSEYSGVAGKLVVTRRGNCDRVLRATLGAAHGAKAVAMINDAPGYPPVEGDLPGIAIPFLGVQGSPAADSALLASASTATFSHANIANPTFGTAASFTSGGPRSGDGVLKPDLAAPGASIVSTGMGTGAGALTSSGTSMSAPHVSGVAALALQAHPGWQADEVSTAIVNTARAAQIAGWSARISGAGLVQPAPATRTWVIARGGADLPSLSFGVQEFSRAFQAEQEIVVQNLGTRSARFSVSVTASGGTSPHSVQVSPSIVSVLAGQSTRVRVRLKVPVATAGDSNDFRDVAGLIVLTPTNQNQNGGAALGVPYYLVARARSQVQTDMVTNLAWPYHTAAVARVKNVSAAVAGTADFYAWGLMGRENRLPVNLRAVGVQSLDTADGKVLLFAVNTFRPWSSASTLEFDLVIDLNGDGTPDVAVVGIDFGFLTTGAFNGQVAAAVLNLATGAVRATFLAVAPTDANTILLPVLASDLGLTAASPRFSYGAQIFDLLGVSGDFIPSTARFNAFENAISTGAYAVVGPGDKAFVPLSLDPAEWSATPALGLMVVSLDNFWAGDHEQAQLIPVR
ncbi:MAG: S8 family serine peptidase [Acidobacteriota bacterium]